MSHYVIGIDFGTLSGRGVLCDVSDGSPVCSAVYDYPHGVLCETLADTSVRLPANYSLQVPSDYIDVLKHVVPELLSVSGVRAGDIIGIGVDFTSCTVLPVYSDGTPLCEDSRFANRPHSYVKLWKHHSAQQFACKTNYIFNSYDPSILRSYGGKVSSEWIIPKVWEIYAEDKEIYDAADYFIEGGDWIVWRMCGRQVRNSCAAGYKALWNAERGYLPRNILSLLDPGLSDLFDIKMNAPVLSPGTCAGGLTEEFAGWIGLIPGTPVSVAVVDGHAMVAGSGISRPGSMLQIMGTSSNQMIVSDRLIDIPGICGIVKDGMIPGYYGYEAGQAGFGDHYAWFMDNLLPYKYKVEAKNEGSSDFEYLSSLASKLSPGGSGLIALDWWNGNRSILSDSDLSGLILGMTLGTRPEEIFRAIVEATAFGTKTIVDNYEKHGITADRIVAAGGVAEKSPFIMQIFSDILDRKITVPSAPYAAARGAAIFASLAAGKKNGGWDNAEEAISNMTDQAGKTYYPDKENAAIYKKLYALYVRLHDEFGRQGGTGYDVMKEIKKIKN